MPRLYKITLKPVAARSLKKAVVLHKKMSCGDLSFLPSLPLQDKGKGTGLPADAVYRGFGEGSVESAMHDLPALLFGAARKGPPASPVLSAIYRQVGSLSSVAGGEMELSEEECRVLCSLCDSASRLYMGQLDYALEFLPGTQYAYQDELRALLNFLRETLFGLSRGASYGIHSGKRSDIKKHLYDVLQIVRHRLAWDSHPEGGFTVDFDRPHYASAGPHPLAEISPISGTEGGAGG